MVLDPPGVGSRWRYAHASAAGHKRKAGRDVGRYAPLGSAGRSLLLLLLVINCPVRYYGCHERGTSIRHYASQSVRARA